MALDQMIWFDNTAKMLSLSDDFFTDKYDSSYKKKINVTLFQRLGVVLNELFIISVWDKRMGDNVPRLPMETPGDVTMVTEMLLGVMTSKKLWPGTWYQKDILIVASVETDLDWLQEHWTGGNPDFSDSLSLI